MQPLVLNARINALMIVRRSILRAHHHHSHCKARRAMVTYIRRSCLDYAWAVRQLYLVNKVTTRLLTQVDFTDSHSFSTRYKSFEADIISVIAQT